MSNRAAVKRRIVAIATHALQAVDLGVEDRSAEPVPVAYGAPSDEMTESCMYFAGFKTAEGRLDTVGFKVNEPRSDDTFTISATIDAFGFDSDETAEEAAERILNAFRSVLDRCQALLDRTNRAPTPGGVPDGSDTASFKVAWAKVGDWSLTPFAPIGDTHVARIDLSIECLTANA